MCGYFSANNTKKYIDILDKLIDKYNNTKHRAIGCTPTVARQLSSYQQVFKKLFAKKVDVRRSISPPPSSSIDSPCKSSIVYVGGLVSFILLTVNNSSVQFGRYPLSKMFFYFTIRT